MVFSLCPLRRIFLLTFNFANFDLFSTSVCPVLYTLNADRNALGGFFRPNRRTLEDCQAGCTENSTCGAIDFVASANGCYYHGVNPTLRNAPGVNHYTKVPCNTPVPVTPAPVTPAPVTPSPTSRFTKFSSFDYLRRLLDHLSLPGICKTST